MLFFLLACARGPVHRHPRHVPFHLADTRSNPFVEFGIQMDFIVIRRTGLCHCPALPMFHDRAPGTVALHRLHNATGDTTNYRSASSPTWRHGGPSRARGTFSALLDRSSIRAFPVDAVALVTTGSEYR